MHALTSRVGQSGFALPHLNAEEVSAVGAPVHLERRLGGEGLAAVGKAALEGLVARVTLRKKRKSNKNEEAEGDRERESARDRNER